MPKNFKIALYFLLFGMLSIYAAFFRHPASSPVTKEEILGAKTNLELFVQPGAGREPIIQKIDQAQKEILVEVYLLSDPEVISALTRAYGRGVDVKVILEEHPFGGGNLNKSTYDRLSSSGVAVSWSNPTFPLTHEKAIIVDSEVVCVLNQNLTASAFSRNREYDICEEDPADVALARNIFEADFERKSFTPTSSNLVVSPETAKGKITSLIRQAGELIDVEMEVIEDKDIIDLLSQKAKSFRVRVILPDFSKVASNQVAAEKLKAAGAYVRTLSSPYVHAKLIVVDGSLAYVGSVNLSTQSLEQNRELGIIVSSNDIVNQLLTSFDEDWQKAPVY